MPYDHQPRFADLIPTRPTGTYEGAPPGTLDLVAGAMASVSDALASCPIVVADAVNEYVTRQGVREWDFMRDFPPATPPFGTTWVEWRRPADAVLAGAGFDPALAEAFGGALVQRFDTAELLAAGDGEPLATDGSDAVIRSVARRALAGVPALRTSRWLCMFTLAELDPTGKWATCVGIASMGLDDRGQIVHPPGFSPLVPYPADGSRPAADRYTGHLSGMCHNDMLVAVLALGFTNTRNVEQRAIHPPARSAAGRRSQGLPPRVSYRVLVIDGVGGGASGGGGKGEPTGQMPLHVCRGHWARYTADAPRFGRPHGVGWFWINTHVRGNPERGAVVKDYAIGRIDKPPACVAP